MKKIIHIATTEDGTELHVGEDEGTFGIMICLDVDAEPFMMPDDPDWLEKKFGKDAVEKALCTLKCLKFKEGQDDPRELFEGFLPIILNAIKEMEQEKENEKK